MSSADKKSSACHGTSHDSKPRYVKKLNFGRRLETNLKIHQLRPEIVVEPNAENLLSPDKELFVNEWLRKHEDDFFKEKNLIYPTSPVLSSPIIKRTPGSPILSSSGKRPRLGYSPGDNSIRKGIPKPLDVDRVKRKNDSLCSSILSNQTQESGSRVQEKSQDENLRQPLFLPKSPLCSYVNRSPVLSGKTRAQRFRGKRLSEGNSKTNSIQLEKSSKLENGVKSEKSVELEADPIPSVSMIVTNQDKKSSSLRIEDETFFEEEELVQERFKEKVKEEIKEKELTESQRIDTCEDTQFNNYKSRREITPTYDIEIRSGSRKQRKSQEENLRQPLFLPGSPSNSCVYKSPVLSGKKRARRFRGKRLSEGKSKTNSIKLEESLKLENDMKSEKGVELEGDPIPSVSMIVTVESPVLSGKKRARRFRGKRLSEGKNKTNSIKLEESLKLENDTKSEKGVELEGDPIPSVSMIVKWNSSKIEEETFIEEEELVQERFEEKDRKEEEEELQESQRIDTSEDTQFNNYASRREMSPIYDAEIESGSSLKGNFLLETKSSKVVRDNESMFIIEETDSEKTESDFIEDADTPDVVFINNVEKVQMIVKEKASVPCKSPSKDSDETFFSRAGSCRSQVIQPSQKISQVSSSKIKPDSLSQINNAISVETSSPKPVVEPFINMLKTEKKKRKAKKGSLVAKLQTLVSREISFMRLWQYQISQPTFQNVNVQFVDLCIQRSYNSYSRQFTECRLIADTHNLLKNILKQDEDSQSVNSKRSVNKAITIMTIPEVVGELKVKAGNRLKVYPPWQILDQENLILSVTYFIVDEKVHFEVNDERSAENLKTKIIERFDCPCIRGGKVVEECSFKFDTRKPNVIEEIFMISS